jgi:hypothetical protein
MSTTTFYNNQNLVGIGSVGIGTTSPTAPLTVAGNITTSGYIQATGTGAGATGAIFANSTNGLVVRGVTGSSYDFSILNPAGGSYVMAVPTGTNNSYFAGNVGIGTNNPTSSGAGTLLQIYDSSSNNPTLVVDASAGSGQARLHMKAGQGSTFRANRMDFFSNTNIIWTQITDYNQGGANDLSFLSAGKGYASGGVMVLTQGGNVGIGTTSPSYTLDVNGQSRIGNPALITDASTVLRFTTNGGVSYIQSGTALTSYSVADIIFSGIFGNPEFMRIKSTGNVGIGTTNPGSTLTVNGSLSKSSGTFDIPHPTLPEPKRLVHSFIEGPRCDLMYRGSVALVNGTATVNIDSDCTSNAAHTMTQGTFEALCTNPVCFLQNDDSFDRVKGKVSGNLLTITCENTQSSDVVNWMVVAERKDLFIKQWNRTDPNGFLIPEYDSAS